ncbi:MAG: hypothetical protein HQ541_13845 [Mariniphaga sp.]|nr:hypothetical protein [Mariniphaga sp.]
MKTKFFTRLALVIVTVAAVTTTTFGQRWNNANRFVNNQVVTMQPTCIDQITDLTDKQITKIMTLEEKHQATMDEFRTQRRSTIDAIEKNTIRGEMLAMVEAHQNEVKSLLIEEQQNQYDLLHTYANPNYAQGRQFYNRGVGANQAVVRGGARGNGYAVAGRGYNQGFAPRQGYCIANARKGAGRNAVAYGRGYGAGVRGNVGVAGYGQRTGRNAAFGRGYGRGFNTIPANTIEDSKEN